MFWYFFGPLWKSQIAIFDMLHVVYGMNSPTNFASLSPDTVSFTLPITHGSSSSSLSPISSSFTPVKLKIGLSGKSFPLQTSPASLIPQIGWPFDVFLIPRFLNAVKIFAFRIVWRHSVGTIGFGHCNRGTFDVTGGELLAHDVGGLCDCKQDIS